MVRKLREKPLTLTLSQRERGQRGTVKMHMTIYCQCLGQEAWIIKAPDGSAE